MPLSAQVCRHGHRDLGRGMGRGGSCSLRTTIQDARQEGVAGFSLETSCLSSCPHQQEDRAESWRRR